MSFGLAFVSDFGRNLSADGSGVGEAVIIGVKTPAGGRVSHFANNPNRMGEGVSREFFKFGKSRKVERMETQRRGGAKAQRDCICWLRFALSFS